MRKYLFPLAFIALLALAIFSGCGNPPGKYGNFAQTQSVELVEDAVVVLKTHYPPATTRLNLIQYVNDAFGAALVETLRRDGYAIAEYVPPARRDKYSPSAPKPAGFYFGYVVDHLPDEGGLRLSLLVGEESLSRLYLVTGTPEEPRHSPLGDWARRQ
jgi:Conjugal transfer protein TrbH.